MPKNPIQVTIKAGESVSTGAYLTTSNLAMIIAPAKWTSANLSFQVSADGSNWSDLFEAGGAEMLKTINAGTSVLVPTEMTDSALYLRLRSGPRLAPVPQEQDAIFTLVCI